MSMVCVHCLSIIHDATGYRRRLHLRGWRRNYYTRLRKVVCNSSPNSMVSTSMSLSSEENPPLQHTCHNFWLIYFCKDEPLAFNLYGSQDSASHVAIREGNHCIFIFLGFLRLVVKNSSPIISNNYMLGHSIKSISYGISMNLRVASESIWDLVESKH